MLALKQVQLSHGEQTVLTDLNLSIAAGERLGVVGPSGVGKTSLLQTVAGLMSIQSGECHNTFSRIGYVFQEPRLLPWLSARDNVALPLEARGIKRKEARALAVSWLSKLHLPANKHLHYPSALSGGMAQRVSLARAFALQPDLLLLDEPFSALDPALRRELMQLCDDLLRDLNCALIYVCHHPEELSALTHQCLVLDSPHQHRCVALNAKHTDYPPLQELPL